MATVKEYTCLGHGRFEGTQPICPHGCTAAIERSFFTPPGGRSAKTKAADSTLRRLAERFGLTDMSNRNGSVIASKRATPAGMPPGMDFTPHWGQVPKGGVLEVGKGVRASEGGGSGAEGYGQSMGSGRLADEIVASVEAPIPSPAKLPPLRPNVVGKDSVNSSDYAAAMRNAT